MALRFRPHVKLNTKEQRDEPVKLKFNYGFGEDKNEEDNSQKNYYPLAIAFRGYLNKFQNDIQTRTEQRNIEVPAHIEYINVLFQSQFSISDFYQQWLKEFGLLGVNFSKFNNEILFAIQDRNKFNNFIKNINNFILKESGENTAVVYSKKVVYIKEFRLLSTGDILQFGQLGTLMNFRLVNDLPLNKETYQAIFNALITYLTDNGLEYKFAEESDNLEIVNASEDNIMDIVHNFDIVLNVTSSLATVIRPSEFNLPERSYGFEILSNDNLPIIGIIDTGISDQTPLSNIFPAFAGVPPQPGRCSVFFTNN